MVREAFFKGRLTRTRGVTDSNAFKYYTQVVWPAMFLQKRCFAEGRGRERDA